MSAIQQTILEQARSNSRLVIPTVESTVEAVAQWFAVTVRVRREQSTAQALTAQDLDCSLPLRVERKGIRGTHATERPLFPGYVFCKFNWEKRLPILITPGVMSVVSFGNKPTPVSDVDMESIRLISYAGLPVHVEGLAQGRRVRIVEGVLAGVEGVILQARGRSRVAVNVDVLQRSVRVDIDNDCVLPIGCGKDET